MVTQTIGWNRSIWLEQEKRIVKYQTIKVHWNRIAKGLEFWQYFVDSLVIEKFLIGGYMI